MLIASQFLLWFVAALLVIAVVALARQVRGLHERFAQSAVCARCGHEVAAAPSGEHVGKPAPASR